MTEQNENREELARLLLDVLEQDQPDPALLARYADDPDSLTLEQRADIEMRLAESPGLSDQIRIVQGFDVRAAVEDDAAPVPTRKAVADSGGSAIGNVLSRIFSAPVLTLAGATAAGMYALVLFGPGEAGVDPLPKATTVARAPSQEAPAQAPSETAIAARPSAPEIDAEGIEKQRVMMAQLEADQAAEEERRSQYADDPETTEPEAEEKAQPELIMVASAIDYNAPAGAISRPRAGAGALFRGAAIDTPQEPKIVFAIAPEHTARVASRQPSLFWYLAAPPEPGWQVTFQLTRDGSFDPEIDVALPLPTRAGLQRTRLVDVGAHIEFGIEYIWSVTIQPDPADPARDVAAEAAVLREDLPEDARTSLGGESLRNASVLAGAGFWYDALGAVADELEQRPGSAAGKAAYEKLVTSAGLPQLAQP